MALWQILSTCCAQLGDVRRILRMVASQWWNDYIGECFQQAHFHGLDPSYKADTLAMSIAVSTKTSLVPTVSAIGAVSPLDMISSPARDSSGLL